MNRTSASSWTRPTSTRDDTGHETMISMAVRSRGSRRPHVLEAYGMAGLRVGYAIAHESTIKELDKFHGERFGLELQRRPRGARARRGGPGTSQRASGTNRLGRSPSSGSPIVATSDRRAGELHLRRRGDAGRGLPGRLRQGRHQVGRPFRRFDPAASRLEPWTNAARGQVFDRVLSAAVQAAK
jgi:hypothetical protein